MPVSNRNKKKALAICGPTASGKSQAADELAILISEKFCSHATTLVVDSMQVYREIPTVTNQDRARPAEMVGIVSVSEEWNVAKHRDTSRQIISGLGNAEVPFVLDAGTGMYLNALVMDIELHPKVERDIRTRAEKTVNEMGPEKDQNPRRLTRQTELELAGYGNQGSIWDGELAYDLELLYIRPDKNSLDMNISHRSKLITTAGYNEIEQLLKSGVEMNHSVEDSIGIRELSQLARGEISEPEALQRIETRTRQLARRQMRWFDKLVKSLQQRGVQAFIMDSYDHTFPNSFIEQIAYNT